MTEHLATPGTARDVADFYGRLVFPSRTSHPEYAAFVPATPGLRVGDFGCGASVVYDALRSYSPSPVFLDLSMAALRTIDYGVRIRADLFRLPLRDASFDRIFCVGVLHHLPEPDGVLDEIARVLAPTGRLVLGVYAPGTVAARLRRLHDASAHPIWRRAVGSVTEALILARHMGAGRHLDRRDVRLRMRDFLDVPFVRYVEPEFFLERAARSGLRLAESKRISAMNVLVLER